MATGPADNLSAAVAGLANAVATLTARFDALEKRLNDELPQKPRAKQPVDYTRIKNVPASDMDALVSERANVDLFRDGQNFRGKIGHEDFG